MNITVIIFIFIDYIKLIIIILTNIVLKIKSQNQISFGNLVMALFSNIFFALIYTSVTLVSA